MKGDISQWHTKIRSYNAEIAETILYFLPVNRNSMKKKGFKICLHVVRNAVGHDGVKVIVPTAVKEKCLR